MSNTNFFSNDNNSPGSPYEQTIIPVLEEKATIEKKTIETGAVSVTKSVEEKKEVIDVSLLNDTYSIEHVSINKVYDQAPQTRQEGDTLIIPVIKEVLVKKIMVVEEIRITKKVTERSEQHQVSLRTEVVTVARTSSDQY